jgi:hypothetical protein
LLLYSYLRKKRLNEETKINKKENKMPNYDKSRKQSTGYSKYHSQFTSRGVKYEGGLYTINGHHLTGLELNAFGDYLIAAQKQANVPGRR